MSVESLPPTLATTPEQYTGDEVDKFVKRLIGELGLQLSDIAPADHDRWRNDILNLIDGDALYRASHEA